MNETHFTLWNTFPYALKRIRHGVIRLNMFIYTVLVLQLLNNCNSLNNVLFPRFNGYKFATLFPSFNDYEPKIGAPNQRKEKTYANPREHLFKTTSYVHLQGESIFSNRGKACLDQLSLVRQLADILACLDQLSLVRQLADNLYFSRGDNLYQESLVDQRRSVKQRGENLSKSMGDNPYVNQREITHANRREKTYVKSNGRTWIRHQNLVAEKEAVSMHGDPNGSKAAVEQEAKTGENLSEIKWQDLDSPPKSNSRKRSSLKAVVPCGTRSNPVESIGFYFREKTRVKSNGRKRSSLKAVVPCGTRSNPVKSTGFYFTLPYFIFLYFALLYFK